MNKVSVVIPCYNAEKYILFAVNSILNQTYKNIEIIIVDDCSKDNSLKILNSIQNSKIKIISLEKNEGYANALIRGISCASGTYIARMDADDISTTTRIEEQVNLLNNNPECAFVGTNRFRILPSGKGYISGQKFSKPFIEQSWEDVIENKRIFVDPGNMFSIEKYKSVGGYRNYQRSGMDVDLWLRLLEKFQPALVFTSPLYGHRLMPNSIIFSNNTNKINQIPRKLAVLRKEKNVAIGDDLEYINKIETQSITVSNDIINIGMTANCLYFNDFKGAFLFFKSGVKISKKNFFSLLISVIKKYFQKIKENNLKEYQF